jgi:hypothetical protein
MHMEALTQFFFFCLDYLQFLLFLGIILTGFSRKLSQFTTWIFFSAHPCYGEMERHFLYGNQRVFSHL